MNDVLITLGSAATQTFTYGGLLYNVIGDPGNTGGAAAPIVPDLVDLDAASTGISFFQTQGFNKTTSNGVALDGTGDASWVKASPSASGWFSEAGEVRIFGYGGLDPTHTYRVEGFSSRDIAGTRNTSWTIGANTQTINAASNSSVTAIFTGVAPDGNNQIIITTEEAGGDASFAYTNALRLVDEGAAVSGPTITDINTNNEVTPGATATLTGTNLTGATGFNIGSESQSSFTVVSDTSITFTTVRGGNPYNQNLTGTLLHPDGNATITVQQVPEAGTFAVTAASPNTTDDASLWTGLVDTATSNPITIVNGDQAWVKNPNNLTNLAIAPDGTITADQTGDFVVQIWLASEGVWGSDQTVTFTDGAGDVTAPTVSSVSVPTAGSYKAGDTLSFTINFSETVNVSGAPQLALNIGGTTRQADYASGTGTSALVFSYTVQAGDNDADGIAVGTLALNGGTIQDAATNEANLTLSSVGATSGVLVDTIRPVITVTGANPLNITVGDTFTDPGATASDNQDGSLGSVTGTGSVDGQTEGQYTITYPGAGVVDSAGNVALDVTRTVNVNAVDAWPFGKGISYAAPKTWTWGGRHPKTGMRVRIFK